jgi:Transposase DDE domain
VLARQPGGQIRGCSHPGETDSFKLPLRQIAEGVITLMELTISAPDRTTISRRAVKLPVQVPHRQLHVFIDITVLQVYVAGQ